MGVAFHAVEHKDRPRPIGQCRDRVFQRNLLIVRFPVHLVGYIIDIQAGEEVFLLPEIAARCIGGDAVKPAAECTVTAKR